MRLVEFAFALGEDAIGASREFVFRRDVTNRAVQTDCVVNVNEFVNEPPCGDERERRFRTDALALERLVETLDLAVALRVVGAGPHMRHPHQSDEISEVASDELWTVVGDNARPRVGKYFLRALDDYLDVGLGHRLANLPVNDESAEAVEQAKTVERLSS